MARKKVQLAFISNNSSRRTTFRKRKKGLMKKLNELSTLCGITACGIIYSPYDSNPEVWPSNSGVRRVISEFQTFSEMDQHKKMVDQESFLHQKIAKASENLERQRKEKRELEMTQVMFQCLLGHMGNFNMDVVDLNDLDYLTDQYLRDVNRRIENLRDAGMEIGESSIADTMGFVGGETTALEATSTTLAATTLNMGSSSSSLADRGYFHQHLQQNFHHSTTPNVGFFEDPLNQNLNQDQNQQQWFMDMMNHQLSYAYGQMYFPFMDDNNFDPLHYQQSQHQQTHSESFSAPPIINSSSTTPITDLNDLDYLTDQYLRDINRRIENLRDAGMEIGESSNAGAMGFVGGETTALEATSTIIVAATLNMGSSSSSLADRGYFHQHQQQNFHHSTTPNVGFYEDPPNQNLNQDQNQQQWFMDMMNHPEQLSYAYGQMNFPFTDDNNFYPLHYQQPQHQQARGESSSAPAIISSSSTTPITDPNVTNNMWFP